MDSDFTNKLGRYLVSIFILASYKFSQTQLWMVVRIFMKSYTLISDIIKLRQGHKMIHRIHSIVAMWCAKCVITSSAIYRCAVQSTFLTSRPFWWSECRILELVTTNSDCFANKWDEYTWIYAWRNPSYAYSHNRAIMKTCYGFKIEFNCT